MRERMLWICLGLLSLLLAGALGLATSRLTEAPIGLSAEPVSAGEALAPKQRPEPTPTATAKRKRPKRTPTPTPTPAPAAAPTVDDSGSHHSGSDDSGGDSSGHGSGHGRSGGDD
jgi:hypothetical protein